MFLSVAILNKVSRIEKNQMENLRKEKGTHSNICHEKCECSSVLWFVPFCLNLSATCSSDLSQL